jgi:outer membrane biosynthesis protein TonB
MTNADDATSQTRPISVAELLAKNGTIGAPPAGGRRRRRRGNADAVTVAELTGEIPIVTGDAAPAVRAPSRTVPEPPAPVTVVEEPVDEPTEEPVADLIDEPVAEPTEEPVAEPIDEPTEGPVEEPIDETETDLVEEPEHPEEPETELTEAEADYRAHLEQRDVDPAPLDFAPPPRRPRAATATGFSTRAEEMSPDPVVEDDEDDMLDFGPDVDFGEVLDKHASDEDAPEDVRQETPSYHRSEGDTLFGGQSVADDLARRGAAPVPEDIDLGDDDESPPSAREAADADRGGSAFVRGLWVVAQCILAVAFGAGLFIAFDQLWRWNTIVALVLSVLVILGLVVGVRVVRKTEDIGSTLIAVAVGALVTLGPLALLQSH